ncbi:MAG: class I adenylate-forming enzyme family protein [Clostridiaceae bacterium]
MDLFEIINYNTEKYGDKVALIDKIRFISFKDLKEEIEKKRQALYSIGIKKGFKVALKMENSVDWITNFLSLLSLGSIVIPISPVLTERELNEIKINLSPDYILDDTFKFDLESIILRDIIEWPNGNEDAIYHLTSGSTGKPKLCIRTTKNLIEEGLSYKETLNLSDEDKILNVLPLFHSYTFGFSFMGSIVSGSSLYLVSKYTPRSLLKYIDSFGATIVPVVPAIANDISKVFLKKKLNLSTVRVMMVGAGSINLDISNNIKEKLGLDIFSNYGSTETGGIISRITQLPTESVGKPMHGVQVKIINEQGEQVPLHTDGDIWVKCKSMMRGYLTDLDQPFDENGFYPMGDIGYLDENGLIYITGRKKNIIKIGGKKVNPLEVQNIILKMEEIEDVFVHGVFSCGGKEKIVAEVVVNKTVEFKDIYNYCLEHLSDYKIPSIINFIEKIPRNEIGKIEVSKLKSQYIDKV